MESAVYLDHNATTPVRPEAARAVASALALTGNGSSVHRFGRLVRRTIEDARERVAALVEAEPAHVLFTSGGTEANTLALTGCGRGRVVVSAIEHVSVLHATESPEIVPVDTKGIVDLAALERLLATSPEPAVVSVMIANNETGVLQPVAEAAALARRYGALVHCDAVQAAGKVPIDVKDLGVHMLTLSAHKIGGPAGIGALVVAPEVRLHARIRGGGQERGHRAGTENASGIAGFGAAAEHAANEFERIDGLAAWRDRLENAVTAMAPGVRVFGRTADRLPNTTCLSMPGVDSETQVIAFDLEGVAVSAGAACSSGRVARSHVLAAMGIAEEDARCAIRVSLGRTTEERDVARFIEAWGAIFSRAGVGRLGAKPAA